MCRGDSLPSCNKVGKCTWEPNKLRHVTGNGSGNCINASLAPTPTAPTTTQTFEAVTKPAAGSSLRNSL